MNHIYYFCITPFFPSPSNWRGSYILDQVKAIQRISNYEVLVFRPSSKGGEYIIDGVKVFAFKSIDTPSYLFNGLFNHINKKLFIKRVKGIGVNINDIQIVHCHSTVNGIYGLALKKINPNIKVALQYHNLDVLTLLNGKLADWLPNLYFRAINSINIVNNVDVNICISNHVKDSLLSFPNARKNETYEPYIKRMSQIKALHPVKAKIVYILNNGVDVSFFHPISDFAKDNSIYRIGCIANFVPLKNHLTLIKAFERLINKGYSNMRLSLLGTGPTLSVCKKYIMEHNLSSHIEWPDEVFHEKLPQYYNSLDLFVMPSLFEGFGCVYTEAYACGVPYICCDNQGASECIAPEESGRWLLKNNSDEELSFLIEKQYKERAAQHLVKPIDINLLIAKYIKYIEQV